MKYALLLNDMREPNIENIIVVKTSHSRDELTEWYKDQEAYEPYTDGRWSKHFKKDSELEWFNPVNIEKLNDYWGGIWEVKDTAEVGQGMFKS